MDNFGKNAAGGSALIEDQMSPERAAEPTESERSETTAERAARYQREWIRRRRRWFCISAVLFVATCISTWQMNGWQYAVAVMSILVAHELGHYLQALRYGVPASPPFFLPMPYSPLGTLGAVIIQSPGYADRKAMFDIAISGPLAGLVLALPCAWIGVAGCASLGIPAARLAPAELSGEGLIFGDPLILQWFYEIRFGPLHGRQVELNPVLFAGWVGIFITALNLLPVAQLDGGHILYTLIGRPAHYVAWGVIAGAAGWMIYSRDFAYAIFLLMLLKMGPNHPPTRDDTVPLGIGRTLLGWLTLAFLVIGFTPTPIMTF